MWNVECDLKVLLTFCIMFRVPHSTFRVVPGDRRDIHVALLCEREEAVLAVEEMDKA